MSTLIRLIVNTIVFILLSIVVIYLLIGAREGFGDFLFRSELDNGTFITENIPIDETIVSVKQVFEISKKQALQWDSEAKGGAVNIFFDSVYDIEKLNACFRTYFEFRRLAFDGTMYLTMYRNSNEIEKIEALKSYNTTLAGIEDGLDLYNHALILEDIPIIMSEICGVDWKDKYPNSDLRVTVRDTVWEFRFYDSITNKIISEAGVDAFTKEIINLSQ